MYNHRKTTSRVPGMSARQYVTTGVTGAAMVGIGVLLAAPPGAPAPTTAEVKLASTESMFPLAPLENCLFSPKGCSGPGGSTPTPLAAASLDVGALQLGGLPPLIGPGGFLFGDGLDADPGLRTGADCNGGNGGLLWGNGGDGANGGTGGNAGLLFGNGGTGGNGLDAVYGEDPETGEIVRLSEATAGGAGGNGALFFGNGGNGGEGGWDDQFDQDFAVTDAIDAIGAAGGAGGAGGLFGGNGGDGGEGGFALSEYGNATGGDGGAGGGATTGHRRRGGDGGEGEADSTDTTATGGEGGMRRLNIQRHRRRRRHGRPCGRLRGCRWRGRRRRAGGGAFAGTGGDGGDGGEALTDAGDAGGRRPAATAAPRPSIGTGGSGGDGGLAESFGNDRKTPTTVVADPPSAVTAARRRRRRGRRHRRRRRERRRGGERRRRRHRRHRRRRR